MRQEEKTLPEELEAMLRFETLLADISARFVNLAPDKVDREIKEALRSVCDLIGLDVAALWQWSVGPPGFFTLTHFYSTQEGTQLPEQISSEEYYPWFQRQIRAGRVVAISSLEDLPAEAAHDREMCRQIGIKSNLTLPLSVGGEPAIGVLGLNTTRAEREWADEQVKRLQLIAQIFANALERKRADERLRQTLEEVQRLRDQLQVENVYLLKELTSLRFPQGFVGRSEPMRRVLDEVRLVAGTGSAVLLLGETGTGKGRIASLIHEISPRRGRAKVSVNCAAIPETLIESELFGREKGAYTGAYAKKAGSFEFANGSTVFLDEVGELPLEAQAKLLRVLEERKIQRLGSPRDIDVDVRIIAASNRDLGKEVLEGRFRADLYYRLNVFSINVPPLRERREDIPVLVEAFLQEFGETMGKSFRSISRSDLEELERYPWPGNIRELRNVIERAAILAQGPTLRVELPASSVPARGRALSMSDAEREHIRSVLEVTGWQVGGKGGAAEILELKPSTLRSRMAKLGLLRSGSRRDISR